MGPNQAPNSDRYLIDPTISYRDKRSLAVLALDQTIRANPNLALEVLTENRLSGGTPQYNQDTPQRQFTDTLDTALAHTSNGVGLFNLADDESFDAITNDETFRELSVKRRESESEEPARRAAYAGLRAYIMQLRPADALQ